MSTKSNSGLAHHTFSPWRVDGDRRIVAGENEWDAVKGLDIVARHMQQRRRVLVGVDVFEDWEGDIESSYRLIQTLCRGCNFWASASVGGCKCPSPAFVKATIQDVRNRLFNLIDTTPNLDWMIISKHPERMVYILTTSWYNETYGNSKRKRAHCISGSCLRGIGDRRERGDLEGRQENGGSLERGNASGPLQAGASGIGCPDGVSTSSGDDCREAILCDGSPAGLDACSRVDNNKSDNKPQEWRQAGQQTIKPGARDDEREQTTCVRGSECEPQPSKRVETSSYESCRSRCSQDAESLQERNESQGHSVTIRDAPKINQCDLSSPVVDSHLKVRPNLFLGVDIDDQATADERIPHLLHVPARARMIRYSGVGQIVLDNGWSVRGHPWVQDGNPPGISEGIDWLIISGEVGPDARPCNLEHVRDAIRQAQAAGVPVWVERLGSRVQIPNDPHGEPTGMHCKKQGSGKWIAILRDPHGADPAEWSEDLRILEVPTC